MLTLLLVLQTVAKAAADTDVSQRNTPASTGSSSITAEDWVLCILTIAAIAAGFHFIRSLRASPPQLQDEDTGKQSTHLPPSSSSSMSLAADPNRAWTLAELSAYNGSDRTKPLLLGCGGKVFDVSSASGFYGPGAAYGVFAGKDASRGLARMEIEYKGADISDLTGSQQVVLEEWTQKFEGKYPVVGRLVDSTEPNSGTASAAAASDSADATEGKSAASTTSQSQNRL